MNETNWYETLIRPAWAPPSWLFGPVWSVLYFIITISFGYVAYQFIQRKISFLVLLPFILNIAFNALFTPIQFGLKNNWLASIDITLVLLTLVWAMYAIWPHYKWVAIINMPYLLWVIFASVLQFSITYLNR